MDMPGFGASALEAKWKSNADSTSSPFNLRMRRAISLARAEESSTSHADYDTAFIRCVFPVPFAPTSALMPGENSTSKSLKAVKFSSFIFVTGMVFPR